MLYSLKYHSWDGGCLCLGPKILLCVGEWPLTTPTWFYVTAAHARTPGVGLWTWSGLWQYPCPSPGFKVQAHEGQCQGRMNQSPPSGLGEGCWDGSSPLFLWEGRLPEGGILSHHLEGVFLWHVRIKPMSKEARMVKTKEGERFLESPKTMMPEASSFSNVTRQEIISLTTASPFSADTRCSINICWVVKHTRSQ